MAAAKKSPAKKASAKTSAAKKSAPKRSGSADTMERKSTDPVTGRRYRTDERGLKQFTARKRASSRRDTAETMPFVKQRSAELEAWWNAYNRMGRKLPK